MPNKVDKHAQDTFKKILGYGAQYIHIFANILHKHVFGNPIVLKVNKDFKDLRDHSLICQENFAVF